MAAPTISLSPDNARQERVSYLLIGFPLVVWCFYLIRFSVNIPWFDDLDPFTDFIRQWSQQPGFSERVDLLFRPNNEHRMIFGKLSALVYYLITGELNFTFLHIAGALFYIGSFFLCWKIFRLTELPAYYFIPVSLLFFQIKTHLVFLWAVCSLQHQPVVFFVCLTIYLLARRRFLGSVLAAFCATFAMSNGMLVWVAGGIILVQRKNWSQLGVWLLASVVAILAYFSGMSTQNNESSFDFLMQYPHLTPLGFLTFLGGFMDVFPINQPIELRSSLPVMGGLLLSVWAIGYLMYKLDLLRRIFRLKRGNEEETGRTVTIQDFVIGVFLFSLVNAFIISVLRPRFGFFVFLLSNYKLYTFLFAVTAYVSYLSVEKNEIRRRKIAVLMGIVGVIVWGCSLLTETPVINERRKFLLLSAYNQEHNGFGLGFAPHTEPAYFLDNLMKDVQQAGIYTYPKEFDWYYVMMKDNSLENRSAEFIQIEKRREDLLITRENSQMGLLQRKDLAIAFVRSEERLYVFPLTQSGYTGKNPFRQYERTKYASIPYSYLEPGTYQIGVLEAESGEIRKYVLDELIIDRFRD